ncbi:MAG: hypothetical protein D4R64_04740 [Porphyromonadaceae bacterium]|nr:MAG: hypothetical protein D4R64_04740 [Porphyromonadaceae bacterium]
MRKKKDRIILLGVIGMLLGFYTSLQSQEREVIYSPKPWLPTIWKSEPPVGCSFEQSTDIVGVAFTRQYVTYTDADTFYPSWAVDDNMYCGWTDGKAYLVGHGAIDNDPTPRVADNSWIAGDAAYMARVTPSIENMNDITKYEFFAGFDKKKTAIWSSDFPKIKPLLVWDDRMARYERYEFISARIRTDYWSL